MIRRANCIVTKATSGIPWTIAFTAEAAIESGLTQPVAEDREVVWRRDPRAR